MHFAVKKIPSPQKLCQFTAQGKNHWLSSCHHRANRSSSTSPMPFKSISRQNQTLESLLLCSARRLLSSAPPSKLRHYGFTPPPSLSPTNPNTSPDGAGRRRKQQKSRYRPPSSLDREGQRVIHSDLPFDFRYSYTESNPSVKPIGLREPRYSPFGPGRVDRVWTGICAPAVDPTVRSLDGGGEGKGAGAGRRRSREKKVKSREEILGDPLMPAEWKILVDKAQRNRAKRQINLGRDGLTHNMLNDIHNNWKHAEAIRIKCLGVPTVDMENVCTQLEDKTGGQIINRQGSQIILYRGRHYFPKKRPVIPLMLWKPREPIYPKLIKTVIDGLTIEETKEMRKRGLAVPALTKLAKNGYYGNLVPMVRDAFLTDDLVRIDCNGLEKSDYRKIGYKLRDLISCVLVSFEKEQIVIWRGKNYRTDEQIPEYKLQVVDSRNDNQSDQNGAFCQSSNGKSDDYEHILGRESGDELELACQNKGPKVYHEGYGDDSDNDPE